MVSTLSRQEATLSSAPQGKLFWPDWASWQLANCRANLEWDSSVSWSHLVSSCLRAESQQGPYRGREEDWLSSVYLDWPRDT